MMDLLTLAETKIHSVLWLLFSALFLSCYNYNKPPVPPPPPFPVNVEIDWNSLGYEMCLKLTLG